jgi:citrate synthase
MFVVVPAWSYRLNAAFEDHAEHEYMTSTHAARFATGDDHGQVA